jgi:hypothetical protein
VKSLPLVIHTTTTDGVPYSHTLGMPKLADGHPELAVSGLPAKLANDILNSVYRWLVGTTTKTTKKHDGKGVVTDEKDTKDSKSTNTKELKARRAALKAGDIIPAGVAANVRFRVDGISKPETFLIQAVSSRVAKTYLADCPGFGSALQLVWANNKDKFVIPTKGHVRL